MSQPPSSLRVAVIATNDPRNVSGGRYHGLMLAYALAASGNEAHVITDHVPGFLPDLEPLAPGAVRIHQTADFARGLPAGAFDWVLVVPTGIFLPDFYESCLDFAAMAGARIGLINFESGNWFNAMAPEPRDPRLWDYWRRLCVRGGLVLSSARVSDVWARSFYHAPDGALRFEVWCPPVNSLAARQQDGQTKDGSILVFVRPQDAHKGASLLLEIDPVLYAGRTVRLVSGRDLPDEFRQAMQARLAAAPDARLEILLRISDQQKFRLLSAAQAVLFPTHFEGFGYPPVEAAFAGTESVCFDLPVLRETVGEIAHFAETRTVAAFEAALRAALAMPDRRTVLRNAVTRIADFEHAAWALADILYRSADRVAPVAARSFRVPVGPFAKARPHPAGLVDRAAKPPAFPPYVIAAVHATGGDVLITGRALLPVSADHLTAVAGSMALPLVRDAGPTPGEVIEAGWRDTRFVVIAPPAIMGRRIVLQAFAAGQTVGDPIEWQIDRVVPASAGQPVLAGISEDAAHPEGRRLRGWVLAREAVTAVLHTPDGVRWQRLPVARERPDIAAKHPGYPSAHCEFSAMLPEPATSHPGETRMLCLTGPPGVEWAVDILTGWPPVAGSCFVSTPDPAQILGPLFPSVAPSRLPAVPAGLRRPCIGGLEIIDRTDALWTHGIARRGARGRLGAVLVRPGDDLPRVVPGAVVRFASGAARRVSAIEQQQDAACLVLEAPLLPEGNGAPGMVAVFAGDWTPPPPPCLIAADVTDTEWWRGVWIAPDPRHRHGLLVPAAEAAASGAAVGARLDFAASGMRRVVAEENRDGHRCLWLDAPIRPLADGAPHPVVVRDPAVADSGRHSSALPFALLPVAADGNGASAGQAVLLPPHSNISVGDSLRFAGEAARRVLSATARPEGLAVMLDGGVDPVRHGDSGTVWLMEAADAPDGVAPPYRFPDPGFPANDPLYLVLATQARRAGAAMRALRPKLTPRPRVLVLSVVSPAPANQGNRVVTRNLIRHLIDHGFDCDVVVQNWVDGDELHAQFGAAVRLLAVPFPQWELALSVQARRRIVAEARALHESPLDAPLGLMIEQAAAQFHPYFIVRDETVDIARALFAEHEYAGIVCNYTHMARVAVELQDIRALPPVAIITHDALSRLPRQAGGQTLDLMYRPCPPELERAALDAVPGAVVTAISASEAQYFQEIGVCNPVVLAEADAAGEMAAHRIPATAFDRRCIVFHGSANPMNIAGLNWFADECWAAIRAAVPDARLIVCGRVGDSWTPPLPGVERMGEVPRAEMLRVIAAGSMTINPCVAGTGLKIKTVEAACLGLPSVCLPSAVEGLEDVAGQFAIVAQDGPAFTAACLRLLTNDVCWRNLRDGALQLADRRFTDSAVYAALDAAMGWTDIARDLDRPGEGDNDADSDDLDGVTAATDALAAGDPWRAVLHAAALIAKRPISATGYRLIAQGLLGCGLISDAVAALRQGRMVAPENTALRDLLDDATRQMKRAAH